MSNKGTSTVHLSQRNNEFYSFGRNELQVSRVGVFIDEYYCAWGKSDIEDHILKVRLRQRPKRTRRVLRRGISE